jgi:hypothetical protein
MDSSEQHLRAYALRHPDTDEGLSCAGTALERATVRVKGKAFVFLGAGELRLKLGDSLAEAQRLQAADPDHVTAGSGGWVKVILRDDEDLPRLERWVDESLALLAPKRKR